MGCSVVINVRAVGYLSCFNPMFFFPVCSSYAPGKLKYPLTDV